MTELEAEHEIDSWTPWPIPIITGMSQVYHPTLMIKFKCLATTRSNLQLRSDQGQQKDDKFTRTASGPSHRDCGDDLTQFGPGYTKWVHCWRGDCTEKPIQASQVP